MASPSTVLSGGLGGWSTASLLLTLGFGSAAPTVVPPFGGEWSPPGRGLEWIAEARPLEVAPPARGLEVISTSVQGR